MLELPNESRINVSQLKRKVGSTTEIQHEIPLATAEQIMKPEA